MKQKLVIQKKAYDVWLYFTGILLINFLLVFLPLINIHRNNLRGIGNLIALIFLAEFTITCSFLMLSEMFNTHHWKTIKSKKYRIKKVKI